MINRSVVVELGGEERTLKFTIQAIEELESLLPYGNVFTLAKKEIWSISEIVSACYCALRSTNNTVTRKAVQKWVSEYAAENIDGVPQLRLYLFAALGLSGLIGGEKSAFESILKILGEKEEAESGKL